MKGFKSESEESNSLMCRMPGCSLKWSVNILHGKVCSFHDESLSRHGSNRPKTPNPGNQPRTIGQVVKHWQDDVQGDQPWDGDPT